MICVMSGVCLDLNDNHQPRLGSPVHVGALAGVFLACIERKCTGFLKLDLGSLNIAKACASCQTSVDKSWPPPDTVCFSF